jgi:hypothetical protein
MRKSDDDRILTIAETLADGFKLALIFLTAFMLLAVPGKAQESPCDTVRSAASAIMDARQSGVPLADLTGSTSAPEARALILDAYRRPIMAVEDRESYVEDYALLMFYRCQMEASQ